MVPPFVFAALVVLHVSAVQLFAAAVAPFPGVVVVPDVVVPHAAAVQFFAVAVAPFPDVAVVPDVVVPCAQVVLHVPVKVVLHALVFAAWFLQ